MLFKVVLINSLLSTLLVATTLAANTTLRDILSGKKESVGVGGAFSQKGEVSFNGKANTVKCISATNLGYQVLPNDMKYKKKVCVTNPGNAEERCFFEELGAKNPVQDGQHLLSTGQNNGQDFTTKLVSTELQFANTNIFTPSAKPEMQKGPIRSCCTKMVSFRGKQFCIQTKGQKVSSYGQLKGGNNFGNTEK
jgi:hypothetical protein